MYSISEKLTYTEIHRNLVKLSLNKHLCGEIVNIMFLFLYVKRLRLIMSVVADKNENVGKLGR